MGRYDDISPEELRHQLLRFARLVVRQEKEGALLESLPSLMQFLGELRQMVFAYEVRGTRRACKPSDGDAKGPHTGTRDPSLMKSLRVVDEAIQRARQLHEELERGLLADDSDDG